MRTFPSKMFLVKSHPAINGMLGNALKGRIYGRIYLREIISGKTRKEFMNIR